MFNMELYAVDIEVFDVFDLTDYEFLQLSRGEVYGNVIVSSTEASGVFKLRNGMVTTNNAESRISDATLHIRSTEPFVSTLDGQLVGHGIRCGDQDYEIIGQTGGKNFHTGVMEHYRVTLQVSDFADYGSSS